METLASAPRALPIVAGHLALDFANTVDDPLGPARHDHASTYEDVVRWSVRVGTVTDAQATRLLRRSAREAEDAAAALALAHGLRDALCEIFGAVADGAGDVPAHWTRLRPFVADALAEAAVADDGRGSYAWAWPHADHLAVVLHPIASAAADLLVDDDLVLVKRCARCPWLFLDHSKNHSRRWCDMNDCGRAQKIERYVARRAASRRSAQA